MPCDDQLFSLVNNNFPFSVLAGLHTSSDYLILPFKLLCVLLVAEAIVMSTALSKASRLKPEIRLAQAISEFEAHLPSDQKAAFRDQKSKSCDSPPQPRDVMRLTAEIDRRLSGKVVGGRCFGPRLTNVLQAVQQFAALGDIIVGGSQNIAACSVWTLVRMSLLVSCSSETRGHYLC
jgi:hypothetical protein